MSPLPFERFWRRFDPRRSVAARLLVGFMLVFLVPASVFLFLIQRRLTRLQEASAAEVAAIRVSEASGRVAQDANFRAEWIDRRAHSVEEAGWTLAAATRLALEGQESSELSGSEAPPRGVDTIGVATADSAGLVSTRSPSSVAAQQDLNRTRMLGPLMADLLRRLQSVRSVAVWTASGAARISPPPDPTAANREWATEMSGFVLHRMTDFPEATPAGGDRAVWSEGRTRRSPRGDRRFATVFVPVRGAGGRLVAAVGIEVDPRRYVSEAIETWAPPGDLWFATDAVGHAILVTPRAGAALGWNGADGTPLSDAPSPDARVLAERGRGAPRSSAEYLIDGKRVRFASAQVVGTGWIFYEGLSREAIDTIRGEAGRAFPPQALSALKRDVLLLFLLLVPAVAAAIVIASRRLSAPVSELVRAAEEIGRGRPVEVAGREGGDELGRVAAAIDTMGKRVARRVETLRRLHQFARSAYRMTDVHEVVARSAQAMAAFTGAERVWFYQFDRNTNRLEALLPAWNVTEELAEKLKVSVDARSIAGMVFRTGEAYCSNDLERDPYASRELQRLLGATNGVFAPLKTEEETLGVAVAVNRREGFGQEEVDAVTSFADISSLMLKNARLYTTLTGTVDELRRASRLKDHFLQNVNHELRTPLTAIVGWTDLFEEQDVDEKTMARGIRQIRQSARVLLALIDDLLDLARLDRGALTLDFKPMSLSEVIQRSIETVRLMADARGVALILAPLPEPMPPVRADALRLQQVLWNLLANAIQFTAQHGRVVVRVEREPERYLVSVEDDGIGIPESELPHVFERFRQVDGSATRGHAGMGIGLALARSLVELHGGTIWASSVVGQGSRFTFALPIRQAERRTTDSGGVPAVGSTAVGSGGAVS